MALEKRNIWKIIKYGIKKPNDQKWQNARIKYHCLYAQHLINLIVVSSDVVEGRVLRKF